MASASSSKFKQCVSLPSLRCYLAEFISTFLFVFVAVGSVVSSRMLTPDVTSEASSLVATGLAQAFGLFAAVYVSADVSGGHVNPAVTFALAICGRVSVPVAIFYWISQLVGSTLACVLLRAASAGQAIPTTQIGPLMTGFGGAMVEVVITFALVLTVCVASGGKGRMSTSAAGPLAVGLVAGACVLAAGSLTGASMNPARSFGPAIVSGDFKDHGVYWAGPLIGAGLAALVHQNLLSSSAASLDSGGCNAADEVSIA